VEAEGHVALRQRRQQQGESSRRGSEAVSSNA
jgi:hypothetical protein